MRARHNNCAVKGAARQREEGESRGRSAPRVGGAPLRGVITLSAKFHFEKTLIRFGRIKKQKKRRGARANRNESVRLCTELKFTVRFTRPRIERTYCCEVTARRFEYNYGNVYT